MFVRNNTTCPNCGKSRIFDLRCDQSDAFDNHMLLAVECLQCSAVWTHPVEYHTLISVLLAVTESLPRSDRRRRAWRWATSYRCEEQQKRAIRGLFDEVFQSNLIDWKVAKHAASLSLFAIVVAGLGGTSIPVDWLPFSYNFLPLGYPLAR